jgi:hypothetical protein
MMMKNSARTLLRITLMASVLIGPMIGMAVANSGQERGLSGAGFVLFVSLSRG